MNIVRPSFVASTLLALWLGLSAGAAAQGTDHRDGWQRVPDVLAALGAGPGAYVADIGAGSGYFTHHLRQAVGPEGRVWAVDISPGTVARLRGTLDQEGVRNVDVVLGEVDDPRLPWGSLDAALIVNAYHEMTDYPEMLAAVRAALRPGGRLVIVDNPPADPAASREAQTARHQIHTSLVERDLAEAGFEVVERDTGFVAFQEQDHEHRMWLLVGRRPLHEPAPRRLAGAAAGPEGLWACPFQESPEALAERPSPADSAEVRVGGARVKVCYSRPSMRGRTVMGDLVPFGEPWRTGANEATVLRTDRPLRIGDVRLEPGWYSLYTLPEREAWTVVVNRLVDRAGIPLDDWVRSHDLGEVSVPVGDTGEPVEELTIRFEPGAAGAASMVLEWERSRVEVPVRVEGGAEG